MAHELTSPRTSHEIGYYGETGEEIIVNDGVDADERIDDGDDVLLTSSDGAVFFATVLYVTPGGNVALEIH